MGETKPGKHARINIEKGVRKAGVFLTVLDTLEVTSNAVNIE